MLEGLPDINLFEVRKVLAVSFPTEESGKVRALTLQKKSNGIHVTKQEEYENFDTFAESFKPALPVVVSFHGKAIISKKVALAEVKQEMDLIKTVLLNANPADFLAEALHTESGVFVSVMRKALIEEYLDQLKKLKARVIDLHVGPFSGATLKPLFPQLDALLFGKEQLAFQDLALDSYKNNVEEKSNYKLDEYTLDSDEMLALAGGVNVFLNNEDLGLTEEDLISQGVQEEKQRSIFNKSGAFLLGFFFIGLIINYLVQGHYVDIESELTLQLGGQSATLDEIDFLQADKEQKQELLEAAGLNSSNSYAFYSDAIASSMPRSLRLTQLELAPLEKKLKLDHPADFDQHSILCSGTARSSTAVVNWVAKLKKKDWIQDVEILDVLNDKTGYAFEIRLRI